MRNTKRTTTPSDAVRLIRFAAILWIVYLIALAIINQVFQRPQPPQLSQNTGALYNIFYIAYGFITLLCLGLAYWRWIQEKLKRAFIPVIITIITVMPVVVNRLLVRPSPLGPRFMPSEGSVLSMFPFLFIGLLLVAWQYKWQHILFVILGIAGLNLVLIWTSTGEGPGSGPLQGVMVVTLIQSIVFLALGFSISYLMNRLRKQQQSLEEANTRLTHYASTLEQLATTRERSRLALELHDTLAHTLSGLSVQLETIKAYWDVNPQMARSSLEKASTTAHSGLDETRRALKALRASPLDDLGLAKALSNMVRDIASRANLTLEMPEIIMMPPLSPDVEQCIYRVTQEAVTNVVKHASAKNLTVKLEYIDIEEKVMLTVHDDGVGFDSEKNGETGSFGLAGMRERTQLVGGTLNIMSQPGHGTTIQLTIYSGENH